MSSKKKAKRTVAKAHRAILKNYRNAQRECVNGCGRAKAGHRYCAACGTALPITGLVAKHVPAPSPMAAPAFLAKGAAPIDPLRFGSSDDPDPAERERVFQEEYSRRLSTPVTKSAPAPAPSFRESRNSSPVDAQFAVQDLLASRYHSDPAVREATWDAIHSHTKGR
ncbi:hypothetical protein ABZX95_06215 [Streptomyces sp. NPDC004232]|uniref:hypothetical protein n=1 Tax=Streptomyces sp. NPDC004232 TaxID=3154454 RepID=UPI0033A54145